jgi:hypothetical protein
MLGGRDGEKGMSQMRIKDQAHSARELDALVAAIQAVRMHTLRDPVSCGTGLHRFYLEILKRRKK